MQAHREVITVSNGTTCLNISSVFYEQFKNQLKMENKTCFSKELWQNYKKKSQKDNNIFSLFS